VFLIKCSYPWIYTQARRVSRTSALLAVLALSFKVFLNLFYYGSSIPKFFVSQCEAFVHAAIARLVSFNHVATIAS
jgi:hypothetical protein